jgi:hypothetical protein
MKPMGRCIWYKYIWVVIDYATKWVEARALHSNTTIIKAKFLYECTLTRFGCILTLVSDQGMHFINNIISHLLNHFLFQHTIYTTYYIQGNGQVESTNKVIGIMLTKLVNEKKNDWDGHLGAIMFTYHTAYKVSRRHTPF